MRVCVQGAADIERGELRVVRTTAARRISVRVIASSLTPCPLNIRLAVLD